MNALPQYHGTPPQLEDAVARIEQAKENYRSLAQEMEEFLYNYVKGMVKGFDPESENFVLQLRHPKESNVKGRASVLISQIAEHLRNSLDYLTFQLSLLNEPELNESVPQFVITDSESKFRNQAKTRLRYLTAEQLSLMEQLQPYNGNGTLAVLGEIALQGKHRRLLSLLDLTGLDIYFAEITKREEYKDCYVYPAEKGCAVFAKPKGRPVFQLMEKYDALPLLESMIGHVEDIVRVSFCFFEGQPLRLTILKG